MLLMRYLKIRNAAESLRKRSDLLLRKFGVKENIAADENQDSCDGEHSPEMNSVPKADISRFPGERDSSRGAFGR